MLSSSELRKIPKVEFHRHLDGSIRFETIKDLIKKNKLDVGVQSEDELRKKTTILQPMKNLQEVLDCFWTTQKVLCNYEAIKRVAFENVEDAYLDGVKLLELRFATVFIAQGKNLKNDEIIEGILDGVKAARDRFKIPIGLIHILPRSLDFAQNQQAAGDIIKYKKAPGQMEKRDFLCGFDLADAEEGTDPAPYVALVEEARQNGLGITIHSGEDTDHLCMERTIHAFGPSRIGHGIKCHGHESTLKLIKEKNIHLEVCPTSNWLTQCVKKLEDHPFPHFYRGGVSVSLNTDDPHLMGLSLIQEYQVAQTHYGMKLQDFYQLNKAAINHSFLDEEVKAQVLTQFSI